MFGFPNQQPPPPNPMAKYAATNGCSSSSDAVYEAKYKVLTRKCLQVKEETDRIYCNLLRSKKLLRKLLHERRLLAERLERYGDQFCEIDLLRFCDEDVGYELLLSEKKTTTEVLSPNATPPSSGLSSASLSRRGSSSNTSVQKTPPLLSSSFFDAMEPVSTAKPGSKKKPQAGNPRPKKDPEAPRKPVNAYFIFCERRRSEVQRQMVEERQCEVDRKEVTRKLSQLWLDLAQDEKKMFYTLYEIEKARYDAQMKEYSAKMQPSSSSSLPTGMQQSSTSLPTSGGILGLPPPFPSDEDFLVGDDQPSVKRPRNTSTTPCKNGDCSDPLPPPPTTAVGSNGENGATTALHDCSPIPSTSNGQCITNDALLSSASEPHSSSVSQLMEPSDGMVAEDDEHAVSSHLPPPAEDVFLLDNHAEAMECLDLPSADPVSAPSMLMSNMMAVDDDGSSTSGVISQPCLADHPTNGSGNNDADNPGSPSQSPLSSSQQALLFEQPSPEWHSLPSTTVMLSGVGTEAAEDNNSSTTNNPSSSTLSPMLSSSSVLTGQADNNANESVEATTAVVPVNLEEGEANVVEMKVEAATSPNQILTMAATEIKAEEQPSDNTVEEKEEEQEEKKEEISLMSSEETLVPKNEPPFVAIVVEKEEPPEGQAMGTTTTTTVGVGVECSAAKEDSSPSVGVVNQEQFSTLPANSTTTVVENVDIANIPLPASDPPPPPSAGFLFGVTTATTSIPLPPPPPPPPPVTP